MDLHVERVGRGAPLVLVHGWAMHGGIFAPLVDRLSADFELHLVDLPGHGHSRHSALPLDPGACAAALAGTLPPALWLGWSLGALVALRAALERGAGVTGVVVVAGSPRFTAGPGWPHAVAAEVFAEFGAGLRGDYRASVDRFLALEAQGQQGREALRLLRAEVFARGEPAPAALAAGLDCLEQCDLRAELPALPVASLWLAGRRDRLVPWQAMQAAAALSPRGRFERIEGAGHAPFLTHPDALAASLRDFHRGSPA